MGRSDTSQIWCTSCGYDRCGLEPASRCPECGASPEPDEIVIWGKSRHFGEMVLRDVVAELGLPLTLLGSFILTHLLGWSWWLFVAMVVIGLLLCAGVHAGMVMWLRRSAPEFETPDVLRLAPRGFAARRGVGKASWMAWKHYDKVELLGLGEKHPQLIIHPRRKLFGWRSPFNFEMNVTWERAQLTRERAQSWIAAADPSGSSP